MHGSDGAQQGCNLMVHVFVLKNFKLKYSFQLLWVVLVVYCVCVCVLAGGFF